jgi:hypothetical protein
MYVLLLLRSVVRGKALGAQSETAFALAARVGRKLSSAIGVPESTAARGRSLLLFVRPAPPSAHPRALSTCFFSLFSPSRWVESACPALPCELFTQPFTTLLLFSSSLLHPSTTILLFVAHRLDVYIPLLCDFHSLILPCTPSLSQAIL